MTAQQRGMLVLSIAAGLLLSACGSSSLPEGSPSSVASAAAVEPSAALSSAPASEESTFGEPSGLWDIPREVQVAYYKAICTAPGTKLGISGTFNDATEKCLSPNGMESDVDFGVRGLLANNLDQMRQSTQSMVAQVGLPVADCPTLEDYSTVVDLTITNDCVISAMKALTTFLNN